MNPAELAEIRARLQTASGEEGRRPRNPILGAVRVLLRPPAAPPAPAPSYPLPRRVGLNPVPDPRDEWLFEPLVDPLPGSEAARRRAFGQRTERAPEPAPLLLAAPVTAIAEVVELAPRFGALLARPRPAAAAAETPYHPEDVSDHTEGETERLYAAAGLPLIESEADLETLFEPPRPRLKRRPVREPDPPTAPLTPEQELLTHMERVFLAELAGLEARRLPD